MVSNKSFIAANIRGYVLGGRGSWISQLGQGARQLAVKRPLGYTSEFSRRLQTCNDDLCGTFSFPIPAGTYFGETIMSAA